MTWISKQDSFPWCVVGSEIIHVLVKIEYNGNTDYKHDGEDVSPQELAYQVFVYSF